MSPAPARAGRREATEAGRQRRNDLWSLLGSSTNPQVSHYAYAKQLPKRLKASIYDAHEDRETESYIGGLGRFSRSRARDNPSDLPFS
ncbi:hypothetical protein Srubr_80930 [Streptomyces rubradiris]|uniref:Uncharacterized protein n=1 Tax=Streptomyces rubradiris TaxID=285531 RepID=A0ABQ3RR48_STRRR|nr:hypothetical protein Srubr_80930 [Streptomyces rubradiris]